MSLLALISEVRALANEDKVIYAEDIKRVLENTSYSNSLEAVAHELEKYGYSVNYGTHHKEG